jgi:alpha-1,4-digalacturonate transport system permease protein
VPWQFNANLSLVIAVIASTWGRTAFSMLLFVSAIANVPESNDEAAALGAISRQSPKRVHRPALLSCPASSLGVGIILTIFTFSFAHWY